MQNKDMLIFEVHNEDNSIFYMVQNMDIWIFNTKIHNKDTVELRYNKGPRDWQILFATTNFLYIEVLSLLLG